METQTAQILLHMKHKGAITPLDALSEYGCFRLGARIYDLKRDGHAIDSEMVTLASGKRVKRYWLA